MSIGSKRITLRIGDAMLSDVRDAVKLRNDNPKATRHWTVTEYVLEAVVNKLNHDRRSNRKSDRRRQELPVDGNEPREYEEYDVD